MLKACMYQPVGLRWVGSSAQGSYPARHHGLCILATFIIGNMAALSGRRSRFWWKSNHGWKPSETASYGIVIAQTRIYSCQFLIVVVVAYLAVDVLNTPSSINLALNRWKMMLGECMSSPYWASSFMNTRGRMKHRNGQINVAIT